MRKIRSSIVISFMVLILLLNFGAVVRAEENQNVDVKIEVGFNDNYKVGYFTPISLSIKNKGKEIKGEVEVRVPSTPGKYVSYARTLNLEKDAEKNIIIDVPVNGFRTKYQVLISSGRSTVYEDTITFDATSNNVTGFIGILSDDYDSLTYINKLPSPMGLTLQTKNIKLTEKNFPENIFTLRAFDLIVINNFDTTKLNTKQYGNLKEWVNEGGTLLVGTGANYKKSLGIFKDDFVAGTTGTMKTLKTAKIYELASNGDIDREVNLEIVPIKIQGGTTLLEEKGENLTQVIRKGNGYVGVAAFDFGQAPFTGWSNNTSFAEKLIALINSNIIRINDVKGMGMNQNYYELQNTLNQFSEMSPIKPSVFIIILLIYILSAAPINYMILNKLDKRELMWVTVPFISLVFAVVVYVSGAGSRISKMTTNMVSIFHIDESGNSTASTYAGIFSSSKSKLTVESKTGEKLMPISDGNYGDPNQAIKSNILESKIYDEGSGRIEYYNTSILQSKMLEIQKGFVSIGKVTSDLAIDGSDLKGKVTNNLNIDLEDCYLISQSEYYKLGDINKGEGKDIGKKETISMGGGIYQIIDQIYSSKLRNPSGMPINSGSKEVMEIVQKQSMLRMEFGMKAQMIQGIYFIGFSKNASNNPLLINGKEAALNERSLVVMPVKPNFKLGDTINYPAGFVPSTVMQTGGLQYDGSGMLFGNGSAEILYTMDTAMKAEELSLNFNSIYSKAMGMNFQIYNVKSNSYEEIKFGQNNSISIKGTDLEKYLTADNKLKIKIELKDGSCPVPQVGAKGKVR